MSKLTVAQIQMLEGLHYTNSFDLEYDLEEKEGFLKFIILENDLYLFSKCARFRKLNPLLSMFFDEEDVSVLNSIGINDNYIVKFWDNSFDENSTEELEDWDFDEEEDEEIAVYIPFIIIHNPQE
jgi:hypothetical protein